MLWSKNRGSSELLYICSLVLFILIILFIGKASRQGSRQYLCGILNTENNRNLISKNIEDSNCSWTFYDYTPSTWETYWFSNIDRLQYEVCQTLALNDQVNKSVNALLRIIELQRTTFSLKKVTTPVDDLLSKLHYRRVCANHNYEATQLIEPFVGWIRDPISMCPRIPSVSVDLYLEDSMLAQSKRFLLLAPSAPSHVQPPLELPPIPPWLYTTGSQKILFDIGSAFFSSRGTNTAEVSSGWFYEYFKDKAIQFDRIIAFEAGQLNPREVWEQLPADVFAVYTFINTGVEAEMGKFNPWTMIEAIAKPNDYVVVKLDIDNPPLESALMKQLLNEKARARSLIDELFYEKHVSGDRNSLEDKLKDSYDYFVKMRQLGVRMHGWP